MKDWTAKDGVANSSDKYLEMVDHVNELIQSSAHSLIAGQSIDVARSIVSHLAHAYDLAPYDNEKGSK